MRTQEHDSPIRTTNAEESGGGRAATDIQLVKHEQLKQLEELETYLTIHLSRR